MVVEGTLAPVGMTSQEGTLAPVGEHLRQCGIFGT